MNRNSIRWRLPASYALIALLAALSLGSIMILVLRNYYAIQEQDYLFGNAMALQPVLEKALQSDVKDGTLQEQVQGLSFLSQSQIRILNTAGEVLADSGVPDSNQMVAVLGASGLQNTYFESAGVPIGKGPIVIYSRNAQLPQVLPFNKEIPYSGPVPQEDMMLSVSASPYGYGFVAKTEFDPARRSIAWRSVFRQNRCLPCSFDTVIGSNAQQPALNKVFR